MFGKAHSLAHFLSVRTQHQPDSLPGFLMAFLVSFLAFPFCFWHLYPSPAGSFKDRFIKIYFFPLIFTFITLVPVLVVSARCFLSSSLPYTLCISSSTYSFTNTFFINTSACPITSLYNSRTVPACRHSLRSSVHVLLLSLLKSCPPHNHLQFIRILPIRYYHMRDNTGL